MFFLCKVDIGMKSIIYRNTVTNYNISSQDNITINVECIFNQANIVSSSALFLEVLNKDLYKDGHYDLSFGAYSDASFTTEITKTNSVGTGDPIYLRALVKQVPGLDVYPIRCFATPLVSRDGTSQMLINSGYGHSLHVTFP